MRNINAALILSLFVAGCGAESSSEFSFKDISNGQVFSLIVPSDAKPEAIIKAAKKQCEGKSWCQVLAWNEAASAASAMPMLPRESETVAFSYLLNRSTGLERALWDCRKYKRPKDQCLA